MKTAIRAFGAIREIEMVSGWPGVTTPSEPTRAFRKTNFVFLPFEARSTGALPATPDAGTSSAHARAASTATAVRVPLPSDTR